MNLSGYWPQTEGTESPEGASPPPSSSGSPLPKLICAWHKPEPIIMRDGPEPASHGLCPACAEEWK